MYNKVSQLLDFKRYFIVILNKGVTYLKQTAQKLLVGTVGAAGVLFASSTAANADSTTHKVKQNETVDSIAKKYGVSVDAIERANNIDKNTHLIYVDQTLNIPQASTNASSKGSAKVYVVKAGDSLSKIAEENHMTLAELLELNNLSEDSVILVGQELKLSADAVVTNPVTDNTQSNYTVQSGDSLYTISQQFDVPVEQIRDNNNVATSVTPGQDLVINQPASQVSESTPAQTQAVAPQATTDATQVQTQTSVATPSVTPAQTEVQIQPEAQPTVTVDTTTATQSYQVPAQEATQTAATTYVEQSAYVAPQSTQQVETQTYVAPQVEQTTYSAPQQSAPVQQETYVAPQAEQTTYSAPQQSAPVQQTTQNVEATQSAQQQTTQNVEATQPAQQQTTTSNQNNGSVKGSQIVATAQQYIGVPYVWGGSTPAGFDCSGLVQYVYAQNGINLPRVTYTQENAGTVIPVSQAQAGDLYFWGAKGSTYHVAIATDSNGNYIQAPEPGQSVKTGNVSWYAPSFAMQVPGVNG